MKTSINTMLIATILISNNAYASLSSNLPDCERILNWAYSGWELDKNSPGGFHQGKQIIKAFKDENFQPTFNIPFVQLNDSEFTALKAHLKLCATESRKKAHKVSRQGDREKVKQYQLAANFIYSMLRVNAHDRDPANFANTLSHQQSLFVKYKQASELATQQLITAQILTPSLKQITEHIAKLKTMQTNPTLAYLGAKEQQAHIALLNNKMVELTDNLIEQEIMLFNHFEPSFSGLQSFNQHIQDIKIKLRGLKSTKWPMLEQSINARTQALKLGAVKDVTAQLEKFNLNYAGLKELIAFRLKVDQAFNSNAIFRDQQFEKHYLVKLNEIATRTIIDFESELKALPATEDNIVLAHRSVKALFKQSPLPENIEQYREAALAQVSFIGQELKKDTCYKSLTPNTLAIDVHNIPLLDAYGNTTLGLFVCQLNENGFRLQEHSAPGFFNSTHVLKVKTSRGITITINLEPVEVNPNETLLVGVRVKDALQERSLSLTEWQNYILQLNNNH